MNWTPMDETVHYPKGYVHKGTAYEWHGSYWHQYADFRIDLNKLQAYDRGIKPIIAHADLKPLPDFCTECDGYAIDLGLCDACEYHNRLYPQYPLIPIRCLTCGDHIHVDVKLGQRPICQSCLLDLANDIDEKRDARKEKPKRVPKRRLHNIIFDFLNDLAIYIEARLS